jgi:O-antigen ligase
LAQRFVALLDLNSTSMRERVLFYSVSGKMIARHPVLGDGPGTYQLNFYPTVLRLQEDDPRAGVLMMTEDLKGGVADHAHNDYLEIWADRGTVGLAAILFFLTVVVLKFIRLNGESDDSPIEKDRVLLALACFGGAACIFINAAFSFPLHMAVRGSLAWVLAALFLALMRQQDDALEHEQDA